MVREMLQEDHEQIISIGQSLGHRPGGKGWFTPQAYQELIPLDIRIQRGLVAVSEAGVIGFITYTTCGSKPYIGWLGVHPEHHRQGIGRALVESVCSKLSHIGASELFVETPTEGAGRSSDYGATYSFYTGMGFTLLQVMEKRVPCTEYDCDMAIMRREIT